VKPPIAYYGAKVTLADRIAALLPAHNHYVEPFAGSLAVLLTKPRSKMETVNDLDQDLMAFWQVLRDRPADLERVCALTPHSRAEYLAAYGPVPDDHPDRELEQARQVWIILTQGRAGTLRRTGWRFYVDPRGSSISMASYIEAYTARLAVAAERLHAVSLECRPALEIIAAYGQHPGVLLYVDPPYLGETRARNYRHEMGSEGEHRELANALADCRSAVVLSGYHSTLYDDLYSGWHRHEIATTTCQGGQRATRVEVLWSNRPFPADEHLFSGEGLFAVDAAEAVG
jgi:DNA adenine methylase